MTIDEVVWFINHKYGEQVEYFETEETIKIYTKRSAWLIHKSDYSRFGKYNLYHYNGIFCDGYHFQLRGYTIPYLTFLAAMHDYDEVFGDTKAWIAFNESWKMYQYGKAIKDSIASFEEEMCYEAYMNGEYE